ncbi:MAG: pyridoxamine 5'-phosphate oxidase family protein [Oscillibacter sp.]|nr:pyridoxamine 5'-phosphate oxidase family protein [Oscillibacter sp.]
MRRKDREVTDPVRIREIIAACDCCRLGLCDGDRAYIVPLDFGFVENQGRYAFYFHGAQEGRKIDLIRKTGWAAFEMDCGHEWVLGETAQQTTSRFQSVMGGGPVTLVETEEEKRRGLLAIMAHVTGRDRWEIGRAALEKTQVFRLDVEELTCKVHP